MSDLAAFVNKFSGLSESYWFYNHTVQLVYEPKAHTYHLVLPDGSLEIQDGVTSVAHILDKSMVLVPWACKMMALKLLDTAKPHQGDSGLYFFDDASLEKWISEGKSAHKEKLDDAGDVGHIGHAWIENYIKAVLALDARRIEEMLANFPYDERASNCCQAALDWMSKHRVRWVSTERKVYSRRYKYAGTLDGLAYVSSCDDRTCCPRKFTNRLSLIDWKTSNYLYLEFLLQTAAYFKAVVEETKEKITDRWVIRLGKTDAEFDPWHLEKNTVDADFKTFKLALKLSRSVKALEGRIASDKKERSARSKEAKKAVRDAALTLACVGAAKYQGIRKPKCNKGNPCQSCLKKYDEYQTDKKSKKLLTKV